MKIVFITNDTRFAYNLRREVMHAFVQKGHDVFLISEKIGYEKELEDLGIRLIDIPDDRRGKNPISDVLLQRKYHAILKNLRPDLVFTNNIKPNIYAGMACQSLKIPYVPNVTGLGTPVEHEGLLQKITVNMYRVGVRGAKFIYFQNQENIAFFNNHKMMPRKGTAILLPGSGVNLQTHPLLEWESDRENDPSSGTIRFLFAARIMKEKGIDLFLDAAKHFTKLRNDVVFDVCGECDDASYLSILEDLDKEGVIHYHGLQKDLTPFYKTCSCFLYPSYYPEGMSNVLLEAAACGRPLIAADRSGCRETVDDGISGYVVPINNSQAVIGAVKRFLDLSELERKQMGIAGRQKMEKEFDRNIVISIYLSTLKETLNPSD